MTLFDTGHRSITGTVDDVARWITSASYGLIHRARAGTACNIFAALRVTTHCRSWSLQFIIAPGVRKAFIIWYPVLYYL